MEFVLIEIVRAGIWHLYYYIRYPAKSRRLAVIRARQKKQPLPLALLIPALILMLLILILLAVVLFDIGRNIL